MLVHFPRSEEHTSELQSHSDLVCRLLLEKNCEETGAQGVAIAAGIGAGVYKDYEDAFEKAVKVKEPVLPDDSTFPIYEKRYKEWCRLNEIMKTYWDEKSKG